MKFIHANAGFHRLKTNMMNTAPAETKTQPVA